MIDVKVEKLFSWRHFWSTLAAYIASMLRSTYIGHIHKVLYDNHSPLNILLG